MTRRAALGSLAWTRQTAGIMSTRDRIAFLGQALAYGLAALPQEVRRALGIRRRHLAHVDESLLAPPDSAPARTAEEHFADPNARDEPHCFTLPAVDRAGALLAEAGWDSARRQLAQEAITLHLNLRPPRTSPEGYVVYAGARLDVTGYRYDALHPHTRHSVLDRHPRLDLKRESEPMFEAQAPINPGSRAHFYTRYLAVNRFIHHAPFDD